MGRFRHSPNLGPDPDPGPGRAGRRRWGGSSRPWRAERARSGRGKERAGGGSSGCGDMAARGSAGDAALRRAAEQWLLWDKVRGGDQQEPSGASESSLPLGAVGAEAEGGLPVTQVPGGGGDREAGLRSARRRGAILRFYFVSVLGAVTALLGTFPPALKALSQRGAPVPPLPPRRSEGPGSCGRAELRFSRCPPPGAACTAAPSVTYQAAPPAV